MSTKYLSRDAIAKAKSATTDVHVPEWKDETGAEYVCVQALSGKDRSDYVEHLSALGDKVTLEDADGMLASLALVDPETRERLFEPAELATKDGTVLRRIADAARKISGLAKESVAEAEERLGKASDDSTSS